MELLATVIGLMVFGPVAPHGTTLRGLVTATSLTDSQVSAAVLGKLLTPSFPLCLVAMEAAAQMEKRGYDLSLLWVPRDSNREADALSNEDFSGFSHDLRVRVELDTLPFEILPEWMAKAQTFYETQRKPRRRAGPKLNRPRKQPLKSDRPLVAPHR